MRWMGRPSRYGAAAHNVPTAFRYLAFRYPATALVALGPEPSFCHAGHRQTSSRWRRRSRVPVCGRQKPRTCQRCRARHRRRGSLSCWRRPRVAGRASSSSGARRESSTPCATRSPRTSRGWRLPASAMRISAEPYRPRSSTSSLPRRLE